MPIDPVTGRRLPGRPSKKEIEEEKRQRELQAAVEPTDIVTLPYGYKVQVFAAEERDDVLRDAEPWFEKQDRIPPSDWAHVHRLIENQLAWRRLNETLVRLQADPRTDPKTISDLLRRQEKLQSQIQATAKILDAKEDEEGLGGAADVIEEYKQANLEYLSENVGEFTWRCPQCGGFNICEVPHYAVDPAYGPGAIWNREVFEAVARYYAARREVETLIATAPAAVRDFLSPGSPFHKALSELRGLTVMEAAAILRIAPIGVIALAWEKEFPLNIPANLDQPDTLAPYVLSEEDLAEYRSDAKRRAALEAEHMQGGLPSPMAVK